MEDTVRMKETSLVVINALSILLVALQIIDFSTTYVLLQEAGSQELNPLMRNLMDMSYILAFSFKIGITIVFVSLSALWVRDRFKLPLRGFFGEVNERLTKAFKFDKLEVRRITIASLLVACNVFYLFVIINNLMGIVMKTLL